MNKQAAIQLAIKFHETYERLSHEWNYVTREDTREFNPESNNGKLMIATCKEILEWQFQEYEHRITEVENKIANGNQGNPQ